MGCKSEMGGTGVHACICICVEHVLCCTSHWRRLPRCPDRVSANALHSGSSATNCRCDSFVFLLFFLFVTFSHVCTFGEGERGERRDTTVVRTQVFSFAAALPHFRIGQLPRRLSWSTRYAAKHTYLGPPRVQVRLQVFARCQHLL